MGDWDIKSKRAIKFKSVEREGGEGGGGGGGGTEGRRDGGTEGRREEKRGGGRLSMCEREMGEIHDEKSAVEARPARCRRQGKMKHGDMARRSMRNSQNAKQDKFEHEKSKKGRKEAQAEESLPIERERGAFN